MAQEREADKAATRHARMRKRVLYFLNTDADYGGAGRILLNLIRELDTSRFEPLVTVSKPGPIADEMAEQAIACEVWSPHEYRHLFSHWWHVMQCARAFQRREIDLIHMNYGCLGWKPAELPAAKLAGVPVITHLQQIMNRVSPYFHHSSAVITCSKYVAQVSKLGPVPVHPVHDRVCIEKFGAGRDLRSELGLPVDCRVVSFLGRARRGKGLGVFVELARAIPEADVRFLVSIQRGGPMKDAYSQVELDEMLACDPRICLVPYRPDVENVYATADVVVLPSLRPEPCPAVLLEAGAAGRAVVATDLGSTSEFIVQGETGRLVPPDDLETLVASVRELLDDPALRERMGRAARAHVERHYAVAPVRTIEALYDQLSPPLGELP